MEKPYTEKLWSSSFIVACLISFFVLSAMQLLNSTISIYVDSLGANASFIGTMTVVFSITALISRVVGGILSDKKGKRIVMAVGALLFAASTIALNFLPVLWAVLLFRLLQGLGFAAASTSAAAAAADVLPKKRFGEGIAYFGLGQSLAMAIGPLIGLALISGGDFSVMFYFTTLTIVIAFILSLVFRNKEKCEPNSVETVNKETAGKFECSNEKHIGIWAFFERKAVPGAFIHMLLVISQSTVIVFLTLFAFIKGIENAGLFFLVAAVAMVFVRLFTGRIYDRYGALPVLIPGMLCGIVSFILLAVVSSMVVFLISGILYGLFTGICISTLNSVAVRNVSHNRLGVASATFYISLDFGFGIGGLFWGVLIDFFGYEAAFLSAGFCVFIAMLISLIVLRKRTGGAPTVKTSQ